VNSLKVKCRIGTFLPGLEMLIFVVKLVYFTKLNSYQVGMTSHICHLASFFAMFD
jgi:hypothetical protein